MLPREGRFPLLYNISLKGVNGLKIIAKIQHGRVDSIRWILFCLLLTFFVWLICENNLLGCAKFSCAWDCRYADVSASRRFRFQTGWIPLSRERCANSRASGQSFAYLLLTGLKDNLCYIRQSEIACREDVVGDIRPTTHFVFGRPRLTGIAGQDQELEQTLIGLYQVNTDYKSGSSCGTGCEKTLEQRVLYSQHDKSE